MPPDFERDARDALTRQRAWLGPGADAALIGRLARFCAVLAATNQSLNLTGITDPEGMAVRHVVDSLTLLPLLLEAPTIMDLGSGGGVPGLPLALACPGPQITLVESRDRKAAALDHMVRELGLFPRVRAVHARGEVWLAENRVHTVVVRAVGDTAELLERLRKGRRNLTQLILMKGPSVDAELEVVSPRLARLGFSAPERREVQLPGDGGRRVLLVFRPA